MKKFLEKFNVEKVSDYIWYVFIFFLPWQTRLFLRPGQMNGTYSEYLTIALYGTDLLLLLVLILWGKKVFTTQINLPRVEPLNRIWYYFAGLEFIIFISIFSAPDKWLAFYHYILFLFGLGIFWLMQNDKFRGLYFYYAFFAAAFIQALLAIGQFVLQKSFAWKWLGLAAHDPSTLGTAVVETADGVRFLQAYGAFDHPNILGAYLAVSLLLFLIWQISCKNIQVMALWSRIIAYVFFVTVFIALFLSFSRAAWLAFAFGFLILVILLIWQKNILGKRILFRFGAIVFILIIVLGLRFSNLIATRVTNETRLEQKSVNERLSSYQEAQEIISHHFLLGTGIGNYTLALQKEIKPTAAAYELQAVHNSLLLIIAELGIVGGLVVVIIIFYLIWQIFKYKENIYFLPLISALIIFSLLDHWLISFHFGIFFLWLVLGLVCKMQTEKLQT